jgi:Na+/H+ antiporter NhaD/arsenite permease-like protein
VNWKTIGALAGLMLLSRGLEASGLIDRAGRMIVGQLRSERGLAMALVLFAAALSAVVTNDVALFVTVPLTLALSRRVPLPVGRLAIFQALAVNAGSTVSPVGNPQNLFLWQASGAGFGEFLLTMLPLAAAMPANRIGHTQFSGAELKTIQEVITLSVFAIFSVLYLKEPLSWNHLVGFGFIACGAFFIFHKWS